MLPLRRFATAALAALLLVSGAGAGYLAHPLLSHERTKLSGKLAAIGYGAGCQGDPAKIGAALDVDHLARTAIQRVLLPQPAYAKDPRACWATARYAPNLIVNAGEAFLVDAWQNSVELEIMKYHGVGTGAVAAAETDTALGTESTTILNPDSTRATGSLTEASASVFRSVGTNTFDGAGAITEWGLFSQAATGGGTLFSRVVFSAINVASADSIQTTWDLQVE